MEFIRWMSWFYLVVVFLKVAMFWWMPLKIVSQKKYIVVGGTGHTTETLRQRVHLEYKDIETTDLSEAEIFQKYLKYVSGCKADYLETKSTNCGNNITYLLDLLEENNISFKSMILSQDASMQKRMAAGLKKICQG